MRGKVFTNGSILLSALVVFILAGTAQPRRLRVKTIANITADGSDSTILKTDQNEPKLTRRSRLRASTTEATNELSTDPSFATDPSLLLLSFESTKKLPSSQDAVNSRAVSTTVAPSTETIPVFSTTATTYTKITPRIKPTKAINPQFLVYVPPVRESSHVFSPNVKKFSSPRANNVISVQSTYSVTSQPVNIVKNAQSFYDNHQIGKLPPHQLNTFAEAVNLLTENDQRHSNYRKREPSADAQSSHSQPRLFLKSTDRSSNSPYTFEIGTVASKGDTTITNSNNVEPEEKSINSIRRKKYSSKIRSSNRPSQQQVEESSAVESQVAKTEPKQDENVLAEKVDVKEENDNLAKGTAGEEKKENENHEEVEESHGDESGNSGTKKDDEDDKYDKAIKSFHNEERYGGEYDNGGDQDKSEKFDSGHFEEENEDVFGKKASEHEEGDDYKEGHNTHGGGVVHKKDEYSKKTEFYDEYDDGDDDESYGVYFEEHKMKNGGSNEGNHNHGAEEGTAKSKEEHFENGSDEHKGLKKNASGGNERSYFNSGKYGKESKSGSKKTWT